MEIFKLHSFQESHDKITFLDDFGILTKPTLISDVNREAFEEIPNLCEKNRRPYGPTVQNAVKLAYPATLEAIMAHKEADQAIIACKFLKFVSFFFISLSLLKFRYSEKATQICGSTERFRYRFDFDSNSTIISKLCQNFEL